MKLIMENWRRYLTGAPPLPDCGILYVFEDNSVRQTSFYDTLNLLNESDKNIELFLEKWERSVDYQIKQIEEGVGDLAMSDPILYLSTQAFMFIDKVKDKIVKYAGKVLSIINKIRSFLERFKEKNPTVYKIGVFAIKIIVAMLVIYTLSYIFGGGQAHAADITGGTEFDESGEIVRKVIATEEELRSVARLAEDVFPGEGLGEEMLKLADSPQNINKMDPQWHLDTSLKARQVIEYGVEQLREIEKAKAVAEAAQKAIDNLPMPTALATPEEFTGNEWWWKQLVRGAQMGADTSIKHLQDLAAQGKTEEIKTAAAEALRNVSK
tara:strand:+ start:1051 stop:2022 length:972 start_codon:yes stop_codon:yes gene_type:complete